MYNEDEYDKRLKNRCKYIFSYKIFFLPITIIMPFFIYFENFQNVFYIFISSFVSSFILVFTFPQLTKIIYTKPIYFEDLYLDDNEQIQKNHIKILHNIENTKKFQNKFILSQQFIMALTISLIIEYFTYKIINNSYEIMELLGLLGGLISLYVNIITIIGKLFLCFLYYQKKKERERLLKQYNIRNIEFRSLTQDNIDLSLNSLTLQV